MNSLLSTISTEDLGPYEPDLDISCELSRLAKSDPLHGVWLAYHYGFEQGQAAAKEKSPGGAGTPTEAGPIKTTTILERTIEL